MARDDDWRNWLMPGTPEPTQLLSRADLLARMERDGYGIGEHTLAYWQSYGVLPKAVARLWNGKKTALFPEWMPLLVANVICLQRAGFSLSDIRSVMKHTYRGRIMPEFMDRKPFPQKCPCCKGTGIMTGDDDGRS